MSHNKSLTTSTPLATGGTGTMKKETKTITSITVHAIRVFRITLSEIFSMGMAIILRWQWKTGENKEVMPTEVIQNA